MVNIFTQIVFLWLCCVYIFFIIYIFFALWLLDFVSSLENFPYQDCLKVYLYFLPIIFLFQFVHFKSCLSSPVPNSLDSSMLYFKHLVELICLHYSSFQNSSEVKDKYQTDYSDLFISRKGLNWGRDKEDKESGQELEREGKER